MKTPPHAFRHFSAISLRVACLSLRVACEFFWESSDTKENRKYLWKKDFSHNSLHILENKLCRRKTTEMYSMSKSTAGHAFLQSAPNLFHCFRKNNRVKEKFIRIPVIQHCEINIEKSTVFKNYAAEERLSGCWISQMVNIKKQRNAHIWA